MYLILQKQVKTKMDVSCTDYVQGELLEILFSFKVKKKKKKKKKEKEIGWVRRTNVFVCDYCKNFKSLLCPD
jgi:hypothetical protein